MNDAESRVRYIFNTINIAGTIIYLGAFLNLLYQTINPYYKFIDERDGHYVGSPNDAQVQCFSKLGKNG